jgi:hypothetical protein
VSTSPIAKELAARIAPKLVIELEERKDSLIAKAGSWLARLAATKAWPRLIAAVPELTEVGTDSLLDEFGGMTVTEMLDLVVTHQKAKGHTVHPSVLKEAGLHR